MLRSIRGGINARRIEDRLGKNPRAAKVVRGERKIRGLLDKIEIDTAQSIVEDFLLEIEDGEIGNSVELEDLSAYYTLSGIESKPNPWKSRSDKIDDHPLLGEVVGMKGSLLVTSLGSSYTIIDLKQVIGYSFKYDEDITMVTQSGLMDFF
jgi:hypothetical protein